MQVARTWVEIDAEALRANYRALCAVLGADKIAVVLKANAYGHGDECVYRALGLASETIICVNDMQEARRVVSFGHRGRVLVMGCPLLQELSEQMPASLELTIADFVTLKEWQRQGCRQKIHLKFDTGMGRQGFSPKDVQRVCEEALPSKEKVVGVSTHSTKADDIYAMEVAEEQLACFEKVCAHLQAAGLRFQRHFSASTPALLMPHSRYDFCRLGGALLGMWVSPEARLSYACLHGEMLHLQQVLSWHTAVTSVRRLDAKSFISYNCAYQTSSPTMIAVLPVGYYDGYPRGAGGSSAYVLLQGTRCLVLGIVCMNMIVVDVSHLEGQVKVGDTATLIGKNNGVFLSSLEFASWSNSVQYEIVTRINPAVERRLI